MQTLLVFYVACFYAEKKSCVTVYQKQNGLNKEGNKIFVKERQIFG